MVQINWVSLKIQVEREKVKGCDAYMNGCIKHPTFRVKCAL